MIIDVILVAISLADFFSAEFSNRQFFFSTRLASPAHVGTPRSKKRIRRRNSRKNNTDCNTVGTRTGTRAVFIGICAVRLSTICYCRCATMPLFFCFFFFCFPSFEANQKYKRFKKKMEKNGSTYALISSLFKILPTSR